MGVIGGKDNFSSKWITAWITDSQNRIHLVPIKNPVDDYFIARVNKQSYCFFIDYRRIQIYHQTAIKSFRVLQYTTAHNRPVAPAECKELEMIIRKNGLPRLNRLLYNILTELGNTERKEFKPHKLKDLVSHLGQRSDPHAETVRNIKNYLDDLKIEQIITPVKNVTEFIQDDLIATDPRFMDTVPEACVRADIENRKMTNTPIGSKKAWLKWVALAIVAVLIVSIAVTVYYSGMLNGIMGMVQFKSPNAEQKVASNCGTPEACKAAIDRGEIKKSDLPPEFQGLIDKVKLPTITPVKDNTIELTP